MTNTDRMTNTELQAAIAEAVEWSNWHFMDENWRLSEHWHLRAEELQNALAQRTWRGFGVTR